MSRTWLLKRAAYLASLVLAGLTVVVVLILGRSAVAVILNGEWPVWMNNLANLSQIGLVLIGVMVWCLTKPSPADAGSGLIPFQVG